MFDKLAVAGFVGAVASYLGEAAPWLKALGDKIPSQYKPTVGAVVFLAVPLGAGLAGCYGVSVPLLGPVACPADVNAWLELAALGGAAFMGSQGNHALINKPLGVGGSG